jgi:hypothetical protein
MVHIRYKGGALAGTPAAVVNRLQSEIAKWATVVKQANIKAE